MIATKTVFVFFSRNIPAMCYSNDCNQIGSYDYFVVASRVCSTPRVSPSLIVTIPMF